jgi:AcrR family transcriptional regulator
MAKKMPKTYHHGDLREALVKAGREILAEEGVAGLTLRACARKANVSHAAPQHHFATAAELLAEIAATGFEDFVVALDKGSARARTPMDKLKAMSHSYVAFAKSQPEIYALMFGAGIPGRSGRLHAAMVAAWNQLADAVRAAAGPENVDAKAMHVWSLVHGFSMLANSRRMPPIIDEKQALAQILERLPQAISSTAN